MLFRYSTAATPRPGPPRRQLPLMDKLVRNCRRLERLARRDARGGLPRLGYGRLWLGTALTGSGRLARPDAELLEGLGELVRRLSRSTRRCEKRTNFDWRAARQC